MALSSVRRADAASWGIKRPAGVACALQVIEYKVEPRPASFARYLLTNDDSRSTGGDEPEPLGPEVEVTRETLALARAGEVLAGARSGPDVDVVGPSGVSQRTGPDSESAEEMALPVAGDVCGLEVSDGSFIDDSCRDLSRGDEVARPLGCVRIVVVVERGRQRFLEHERAAVDAQESRRGAPVADVDREVARDDRLGRPRRGRQPAVRERGDLTSLERARRDLAQDLGDDGERAHDSTSGRTARTRWAIPATTRAVSIGTPTST